MAKHQRIAEINVVPYIDVMLVLLVIFMITAPLLSQGVKVELPQAKANALSPQQEPLIVSIDTKGQYFLNTFSKPDQAMEPKALLTRVAAELELAKRAGQTRRVFVKGDKQVTYDHVMQAMVLLQQAGAEQVGLLTEPIGRA